MSDIRGGLVRTLARAVVLGLVGVAGVVTPSRADTGHVHMLIDRAGFIIGVGGGYGWLTFHGHRYHLTISGVSFGAVIGASRTELVGSARHMFRPSDIAGTYTAIGAGAAVAGGASAVQLQNAKGVVLTLQGRKVGLEASLAIGGLEIRVQ